MKTFFSVILLFIFSNSVWSQKGLKGQHLIIKGQLKNCLEKKLVINFRNINELELVDTITLDDEGSFYLKTDKIKGPQLTNIQGLQDKSVQIRDIFVAPGYELTVTGDVKDFLSLLKSTKIAGKGEESNNYRAILNAIRIERMDMTDWNTLDKKAFLNYISQEKKLKDSIANIVFEKQSKDRYLPYFGKMVKMDNNFDKLNMLFGYTMRHNFSFSDANTFIQDNLIIASLTICIRMNI